MLVLTGMLFSLFWVKLEKHKTQVTITQILNADKKNTKALTFFMISPFILVLRIVYNRLKLPFINTSKI